METDEVTSGTTAYRKRCRGAVQWIVRGDGAAPQSRRYGTNETRTGRYVTRVTIWKGVVTVEMEFESVQRVTVVDHTWSRHNGVETEVGMIPNDTDDETSDDAP
jgi:hypothetical protein